MSSNLPRGLRWFNRSLVRVPLEIALTYMTVHTLSTFGWGLIGVFELILVGALWGTEVAIQLTRAEIRRIRRDQHKLLAEMDSISAARARIELFLKDRYE